MVKQKGGVSGSSGDEANSDVISVCRDLLSTQTHDMQRDKVHLVPINRRETLWGRVGNMERRSTADVKHALAN